MKTENKKPHILVVEDESFIFMRLQIFLKENNYSVDEYTKSVAAAKERIENIRPDLVLLDIELEGDLTGIDLGKELYEQYKIPFIYVTKFYGAETFNKALETTTPHAFVGKTKFINISSENINELENNLTSENIDYLESTYIVETKPVYDPDVLLRAIKLALNLNKRKNSEGLVVLKEIDKDKIKSKKENKLVLSYEDILYFKTFEKKVEVNKNHKEIKTIDNSTYYLKNTSLSTIIQSTPQYFSRISEQYLINLNHLIVKEINTYGILYFKNGITLEVNEKYKDDLQKKLKSYIN